MGRIPGWASDLAVAALFITIAVVAERQTQGRIASSTIAMGVGLGTFMSLRVGATLARAGRTLGCGFVFALTWLLPCATALFFTLDPRRRAVVRDSPVFFVLLGLFVILVMVITFERVRVADVARFERSETPTPPKGG